MKKYILKLVDAKSQATLQKWKLKKDQNYIIGRSDKVEIQINEDSISRKHAEICVLEDSITIKDLKSANGTFVDDKILKENQIVFLKNATKIYFGDSPNYLKVKGTSHYYIRNIKMFNIESFLQMNQKQKENKRKMMKPEEEKAKETNKKNLQKEEEEEDENEQEEQKMKVKKNKKESEKSNQERERSRSYEKQKPQSNQKDIKEQVEQKGFESVGKVLDAKEKRKLLWSNKKTDNLESKAQIYGKVEANQEETNKFFKLLGFKQSVEGKSVSAGPQNFFIKKSGLEKQTMNNDLENQFNEGLKRKNGGKNGLGFN